MSKVGFVALLFASKMGADPGRVRQGLMGGLALTAARQLGLSLPNTASAQELFNACTAHGGKAWDHSAMVRALELLANHEIGAAPA